MRGMVAIGIALLTVLAAGTAPTAVGLDSPPKPGSIAGSSSSGSSTNPLDRLRQPLVRSKARRPNTPEQLPNPDEFDYHNHFWDHFHNLHPELGGAMGAHVEGDMRRVVDEKLGLYLLAAHERDDEAHLVESRRGNHPDFQHILAGHNPARALDPQLIQHRIQEQEWRLDYPSARKWLVKHEDKVVGRLYMDDRPSGPADIVVLDFAIKRRFHGQGYAEALAAYLKRLSDHSGNAVRLRVARQRPLRRWLHHRGFKEDLTVSTHHAEMVYVPRNKPHHPAKVARDKFDAEHTYTHAETDEPAQASPGVAMLEESPAAEDEDVEEEWEEHMDTDALSNADPHASLHDSDL